MYFETSQNITIQGEMLFFENRYVANRKRKIVIAKRKTVIPAMENIDTLDGKM
jgi:hypothetical protein